MFAFEVEEKSIKKISLCDDINKKIITWQKQQSSQGKTALMHAVIDGNLKMVELLCQKGKIDITAFNAQDNNGMTAVMHAAKLGHRDILKFFYNIPAKLTDDIHRKKFSYSARCHDLGYNALMLAVTKLHVNCLEFLYICDVIGDRDSSGKTALMHSVIDGNLKMVKLLCQKIDITSFNAQDNNGMTAVMHAAKLGHCDILKFFYNIPAKLTGNIDEQNFSYVAKNRLPGLNALMLAIVNWHIDCLELLYCKEIQYIINNQDNEGRTAIMLALAEIAFGNVAGSKEEIENAKGVLDELFRVVEVVFNERDEGYLNPQFDNKLNLAIKDENKHNVFAYAKEAKCEQELLDFITSIPMDATNLDLSVYKLPNGKQCLKDIKCSEDDLTSWTIFSQTPEILFESSKEDHDNSNLILKKLEQMVNNISSFFQSKLAHLLNQEFNKNYKIGKHPTTEVNVNNVEQMKNAVKKLKL